MRFSSETTLSPHALHESCDRAEGNIKAMAAKLPLALLDGVDASVLSEDLKHLGAQSFGSVGQMVLTAGRDNLQHGLAT